ncbi:MAG: hypothetical protein RQ722_04885 [Desulfuromonadales bacterium]|nr:hypothetical protein [Desulfuromonadales bacterium]
MTIDRTTEYLLSLLNELRKLPHETEWLVPADIFEYGSSLPIVS